MKKASFVGVMFIISLFAIFPFPGGQETVSADLVVGEDETLTISDQTYFIEGDMIVEGTLNLNEVTLVLNATEDNHFVVEDDGVFNVQDSKIISYQEYVEREMTLDLNRGYNLISVPFYRNDSSVESVLSPLESYYDKVYYYDPWDPLRPFKSFMIDRPEHFNTLKKINRTMGVEVNVLENKTVTFEGCIPSHFDITLKDGENWIAYPFDEKKTVEETFPQIIGDISSIKEKVGGIERTLTGDDVLIPGRGYKLIMENSTTWSVDIPYGLEEKKASSVVEGGGLGLTFEKGSLGSISNSTIPGSRNPNSQPDLLLKSSMVEIDNSTFGNNTIGIKVENSSPTIKNSDFESYLEAGLQLNSSSIILHGNDFRSMDGWGLKAVGGAPDILANHFSGHRAISLFSTSGIVADNNVSHITDTGIYIEDSTTLLENNILMDVGKTALMTIGAELRIRDNYFYKNGGAIYSTVSNLTIHDNLLIDNGFGIKLIKSDSKIMDNEISETSGIGIRVSESASTDISQNIIHNNSYGLTASGEGLSISENIIRDCDNSGINIKSAQGFSFAENLLKGNGGVALIIQGSEGCVRDNTFRKNSGGVQISSSITFVNNSVADNELYGISIIGGSPFLEKNVLSGNKNHAIKCEHANALIKSTSILGSRYHIYLVSSNVTVVNSFIQEDKIWKDDSSKLSLSNQLTLDIEEDTTLQDYDLIGLLPPDSNIVGWEYDDNLELRMDQEGIDFIPADDFFGFINISFNVSLGDHWNTTFPITLHITPINDPPVITKKSVNISYNPTKVRWLVSYKDVDEEPPNYIELVLNGDNYAMKELNSSDHNYSDGKLFWYEKYLEDGEYEYYFIAQESNPHGSNVTEKTALLPLSVDSPKSGYLNTSIIIIGVILLSLLIVSVLYHSYFRHTPKGDFNFFEEGSRRTGSEEGGAEKETRTEKKIKPILRRLGELEKDIEDKTPKKSLPVLKKRNSQSVEKATSFPVLKRRNERSSVSVKSLPVLSKKGGEKRTKSDSLPVLKKREGTTGEHKENVEEIETRTRLRDISSRIDIVSEVEDISEDEWEKQPSKRKHRVIKSSKKKSITPKERVLKSGGKEKKDQGQLRRRQRVLRD